MSAASTGVTVVAVKHPDAAWTHTTGETVLSPGDPVDEHGRVLDDILTRD